MIYLIQNSREYDYDIRAIALAFFSGEKITEITEEDRDRLPAHDDSRESILMEFHYLEDRVTGSCRSLLHPEHASSGQAVCNYRDHEHCRNEVCRFLYRLFQDYTGKELPWGMLTGIRPTKIFMAWMEEGEEDSSELESRFCRTYLADRQKAHLCRTVAQKEREILAARDYAREYSLYIGIPFCPTTCLYCSFTSFPVSRFGKCIPDYMQALFREMEYVSERMRGKKLTTVYVGGGTPTALDPASLALLMDRVHALFPVSRAEEFTVEAGRPDSVTDEKLKILKDAGVGRISINPQTMHQDTLDLIGRKHTVTQTLEAYSMAREAGFDNINMDMITGLPGERLEQVEGTLDGIFRLKPESLTVHSLAIKRAANLNIEIDRYRSLVYGSTNEMLTRVDQYAREMGMEPYYMYRQKNIPGNLENIGYSIPGKECLYNILIMEEKQDIISCGAGATTKVVFPDTGRIERTENVKSLEHYIARIDEMIDRKRQYLEDR